MVCKWSCNITLFDTLSKLWPALHYSLSVIYHTIKQKTLLPSGSRKVFPPDSLPAKPLLGSHLHVHPAYMKSQRLMNMRVPLPCFSPTPPQLWSTWPSLTVSLFYQISQNTDHPPNPHAGPPAAESAVWRLPCWHTIPAVCRWGAASRFAFRLIHTHIEKIPHLY